MPFLARGKQGGRFRKFAEEHHGDAKGDIATAFVSRIFRWLGEQGTQAVVTPQNWLFLTTYRRLRERLLKERTWNVVARLGSGAFETISGEVVNVALTILSAGHPGPQWEMVGVDVSAPRGQRPIKAAEKAELLQHDAEVVGSRQAEQVKNPDAVVLIGSDGGTHEYLRNHAAGWQGVATSDYPRFGRFHWELMGVRGGWRVQQTRPRVSIEFDGRERVIYWEDGHGRLTEVCQAGAPFRGCEAWGLKGVAVGQMGTIPVSIYEGDLFDNNTAAIVPFSPDHLPAVWAFCSSPEYAVAVREFDQKLNVTNATLVKVPFDLEHWTKVAAERYPNGLPEPYSDDPTQWIFHGDPCRSVIWDGDARVTSHGPTRFDSTVLQVSVARLLGYRWPAERDPEMRLTFEQRAIADRCAAPTTDSLTRTGSSASLPPGVSPALPTVFVRSLHILMARNGPPPPNAGFFPPPRRADDRLSPSKTGSAIGFSRSTASSSTTVPLSGTSGTAAKMGSTRSSTTTALRGRTARHGERWSRLHTPT